MTASNDNLKLGVVETQFAELIWKNAPIGSRDLSKICEKELDWRRPTTYNVLRKLCEKGIVKNENGIVSAVISREQFYAIRGERFVTETYGGSLPAFVAAFTSRRKLTAAEAEELEKLIAEAKREG